MMSVDDGDSTIAIPSSLRTIQPFLDDAQKFLRQARRMNSGPMSANYVRSSITCVNLGFRLNAMLNAELSPEDRACLDDFLVLRRGLISEVGSSGGGFDHGKEDEPPHYRNAGQEDVGTHELLIAEADSVLRLADEQWDLGMRFEAMLNFHTACVFFRVMETMVPSKASSAHHARLLYAAQRVRQSSSLYQNFVRENFTGGSCSEVYEVHGTSKLGKGSYGSVYLATHRVTGDERAVKVMNVDRITSYYLRKLHTEIAILKSLDHPNIIKLQDVFFGKRSVYIVTDLCRGGELFELLNSGKNQGFVFREDRASKLMRDMLSAVHYLHERGIVHRDLKLENFLFEDHHANSPLILIDFGLSKHFFREEKLTQKVGSCYYTAPEVLNGNYDFRCDLWSLGVLCYMLLSGSPPFYGKSVEDVYNAILTKEASFADKKFKHVSNACMDFMKRLLVRDPRHRMTTGEALLHPFITGAAYFPRYVPGAGTAGQSQPNLMDIDSTGNLNNNSNAIVQLHPDQALQILDSMVVFCNADPLSRLILEMVSHSLGPRELQKFREEFQSMDSSHTGRLCRKDFLAGLSGSASEREVDLKAVFDIVSVERRYGRASDLSYHEYVAAAMHGRVAVNEARVLLVCSYLDPEHRGAISVQSLRSALGEDVPDADLQQLIAIADTDRDGLVTKEDILELWHRVWGTADDNSYRHK
jgi:calcium-dependent protein kinase